MKKITKEKRLEYDRRYYAKHKNAVDMYRNKWRIENKNQYEKRKNAWYLKNRNTKKFKKKAVERMIRHYHTARGKYTEKRFVHKKRGWKERLMTIEEFKVITNNPCIYCGSNAHWGIDRVDNQRGYSKANSVSCCGLCNHMKWKLGKKEFLNHINKIYLNHD